MHISEGLFDRLGYIVDDDGQGTEFPLSSNICTQHHRQCFTFLSHLKLCSGLLVQSQTVVTGVVQFREQEMIDRQHILKANNQAEKYLLFPACHQENSGRSLLADTTLLDLLKLKKRLLVPFVHLRCLATSTTSMGQKITSTVGKLETDIAILAKFEADKHYKPITKEDSLLLQASCLHGVSEPTLKVEEMVQSEVQGTVSHTDPHVIVRLEPQPSTYSFASNNMIVDKA